MPSTYCLHRKQSRSRSPRERYRRTCLLGTIATLCDSRVFSLTDERKIPRHGNGQLNIQLDDHAFPEGNESDAASSLATSAATASSLRRHPVASNEALRLKKKKTLAPTGAGDAGNSLNGRQRNPLIDALAQVEGILLHEIGAAAPRLATALKGIRQSTPEVYCAVVFVVVVEW